MSFDFQNDSQVVETPQAEVVEVDGGGTSFDDFPEDVEEVSSKEEVKENKDENGRLGNLQDQEENEDEEKVEAKEKEEKKDIEEEEEKTEGQESDGEEDESVEYDMSEELPVKIDGEMQNVSLQDLVNNYSGVTNHTQKLQELDVERQEFQTEKENLGSHINEVVRLSMDEEGNPMDGLNYLLDRLGVNTYDFNKRVLGHYADQVRELDSMTDDQRDNYFKDQKIQYLEQVQQSKDTNYEREQTERNFHSEVSNLREANGVSEDQYQAAEGNLRELGVEQLTPEAIVEHAVTMPVIETAEEILRDFDSELLDDSDLVSEIVKMIRDDEFTAEEVKGILEESFQAPKKKTIQRLNKKAPRQATKIATENHQEDHFETFEDFDNE